MSLHAEPFDVTEPDLIWNRACGADPLRTLPGDRALADMLYAHGLAMNGGLLHAIECMTANELDEAQAGYQFFGLGGVASLLYRARRIFDAGDDLERHEAELDGEYVRMIASDSALVDRFEAHLASNPLDFAPLRVTDLG